MGICGFIKKYYRHIIPYVFLSCLEQIMIIYIINKISIVTNSIFLSNTTSLKNNVIMLIFCTIITIFTFPLFRLVEMKHFIYMGFNFDEWFYSRFIENDKTLIDKFEKGLLLNRAFMDPIMYRSDVIQVIGTSSIFIVVFTISFVMIARINLSLSLICTCLSITPMIFDYYVVNKLRNMDMKDRNMENEIASREKEVIDNLFFIKSQNLEGESIESFHKYYNNYFKFLRKKIPIDNTIKNSNELYGLLCNIVIYIIVSLYISYGRISVGDAINFLGISMILKDNTINLNAAIKSFISFKNSKTRLIELMDTEKNGDLVVNNIDSIKIDNVTFGYNSNFFLKNINININKGDKLVLKGKNGSGKTTLCKLILGIYKNYTGEIYINDISLRDINLKLLRGKIFMAEQFPFIFNETVYNNIKYCCNNCSESNIENVLSKLDLYKIKDKIAGVNGSLLSGGQKQKISIARAMLSSSEVIVLDEPTTALDNSSKDFIRDYFNKSYKTIIIISHENEFNNTLKEIILDGR